MSDTNLPTKITSIALVSIGVALLSLNIIYQGGINVALPLVFLLLGGGFLLLTFHFQRSWKWAALFYIPAVLFSTFGVIFLLNVLTNDWNAWSYAWMLLVAATGVGALLASPALPTWPVLKVSGWIMFILGMTCFVVFGAIAGGIFIQIAACILLVLAGLSIRWFHLERVLPIALQKKLHLMPTKPPAPEVTVTSAQPLVEPLSNRELEVLRLIDAGLSNQQIAERLSVAPSTIKTHINNIYGKLGVDTRVQALNRARELGLLDAQSPAN
jgi:DNA-binding CsgD family transcriptional regulator